jgi:hypothetical protein
MTTDKPINAGTLLIKLREEIAACEPVSIEPLDLTSALAASVAVVKPHHAPGQKHHHPKKLHAIFKQARKVSHARITATRNRRKLARKSRR